MYFLTFFKNEFFCSMWSEPRHVWHDIIHSQHLGQLYQVRCRSIFRRVIVLKSFYSERFLFRRFIIPKIFIPKGLYSEDFYQEQMVVIPKLGTVTLWDKNLQRSPIQGREGSLFWNSEQWLWDKNLQRSPIQSTEATYQAKCKAKCFQQPSCEHVE